MDDYLPDFGTYLRDNANSEASFSLASVPVTALARVGMDLFSVTMTMPHMGQAFSMTIDFERPQLVQLLAAMPEELAVQLAGHFAKPFQQPQLVNLPIPIEVSIETKLGTKNSNSEESYVPLIATAIRSVA